MMRTETLSKYPARKPIFAIAAMDEHRAIGRSKDIPWRIPGEQQRFRELTMGNAVIMGRLTFESIGKPLPGRHIVVLTRSSMLKVPGIITASSPDEAVAAAEQVTGDAVYIGGGEEVYRLFLPRTDRIYLTQIHKAYEGDRHFPEFEGANFALQASERVEGPVAYTYLTYERIP